MSREKALGEQLLRLSPEGNTQRHRTLADRVTAELHIAILQGQYPGGAHLRINDLAERFDTSMMPVREALGRLAALGLVEILPHKGARVLELSKADLEDTFHIRLNLECYAIREAAGKFDPELRERALATLERHERLLDEGDVEGARHAHTEFHFLLYSAAGSRWLLRAIEPVWQNSERYRFALSHRAVDRDLSHEEHVRILDACTARDADEAVEAMQQHLAGAMARMSAAMDTRPAAAPDDQETR